MARHRIPPRSHQRGPLLALLACCCCLLQLQPLVLSAAPSGSSGSIVAKKYDKFVTDEALAEFYSQNLEKDFEPHRQGSGSYTLMDIHKTAAALRHAYKADYRFLAVVKNRVIHVAPIPGKASVLAATRVKCQLQNSQYAIEQKAPFPDSIFVLNIWDQPVCKASGVRQSPCFAPIMSVYKDAVGHSDILVPHPCYKYEDLRQYPWEKKIPKAFMRASVYGSMQRNCTRVMLYNVSLSERGKKWLDVGIVTNQHQELALPIAERVPMYEHPKWKYLINGDGVVASSRLGSLLGMDSLILKSTSPSVEYYYRSLTPGQEFVPFKADGSDILDVVEELEKKEPAELQRVANAARAFQQKYLNRAAKALYMRKVLTTYNAMFPPGTMSSLVASLDDDKLNNTQYIMEQIVKFTATAGKATPTTTADAATAPTTSSTSSTDATPQPTTDGDTTTSSPQASDASGAAAEAASTVATSSSTSSTAADQAASAGGEPASSQAQAAQQEGLAGQQQDQQEQEGAQQAEAQAGQQALAADGASIPSTSTVARRRML